MKRLLVIAMTLAMVCTMAATATAAEVVRMAADDLVNPDNYIYAPNRYIAKVVEEASSGKMKLEIHGGAVLGNGKAIVEQCQAGIIEFVESVEGLLAYWYPNIQVLAIPYLFRSYDVAYEVLDGPFGKEMAEDFRMKTGLRIITWAENGGFRNFTTSKKQIKSPADMKGLKIRTMEIPAHMAMVKALGANPIPIAWTELYTALQTGVADGEENAIPTILLGKLEEVQKYVILDGHVYSMQFTLVNDAWFQKQDKPMQNSILSAGRIATVMTRGICRLTELNGTDLLKKAGMTVYQPTAEEYNQFKTLAQKPVIAWLRGQKNVDSAWIDKLLKAVNDAEKKLGYIK
jgi:tripartite ATP-independent transporter DctP family solute receptor